MFHICIVHNALGTQHAQESINTNVTSWNAALWLVDEAAVNLTSWYQVSSYNPRAWQVRKLLQTFPTSQIDLDMLRWFQKSSICWNRYQQVRNLLDWQVLDELVPWNVALCAQYTSIPVYKTILCSKKRLHRYPGWRVYRWNVVQVSHWKLTAFLFQLLIHSYKFLQFRLASKRIGPRLNAHIRLHSIILESCKPGCKPGFRPGLQPGFRQFRAGLRHAFDQLSTFFVDNLIANHSGFAGSSTC